MIAMVAAVFAGMGGLLWFMVRKNLTSGEYQPSGKIRWSDKESEA